MAARKIQAGFKNFKAKKQQKMAEKDEGAPLQSVKPTHFCCEIKCLYFFLHRIIL